MILAEPIERINKQLTDEFSIHTDGRPKFRVVWSEDQLEKRFTFVTKEGYDLANPIVMEVPKYKHYIRERFILEQLSVVPENTQTDLIEKLSYEPLWVFEDRFNNYLPPRFDAARLVIEQMYLNMAGANKGVKKYIDPNSTPETKEAELNKVEEMLFGEETPVGDALRYGYGVTVPENKLLDSSESSNNDKTVH